MPLHDLEDMAAVPGNQVCKPVDVAVQDSVDTLPVIGHECLRSCETGMTLRPICNLSIIPYPPSGPQTLISLYPPSRGRAGTGYNPDRRKFGKDKFLKAIGIKLGKPPSAFRMRAARREHRLTSSIF